MQWMMPPSGMMKTNSDGNSLGNPERARMGGSSCKMTKGNGSLTFLVLLVSLLTPTWSLLL